MARGALLNLIPSCEELLVRSLKAGDSFDCCYHEIVELRILREGNETKAGSQSWDCLCAGTSWKNYTGKLVDF